MSERRYKLKRGVVIQLPDTTDVYTHVNITDEVAKAYLAKFPQKATLFEVTPEESEDEADREDLKVKEQQKKRKK